MIRREKWMPAGADPWIDDARERDAVLEVVYQERWHLQAWREVDARGIAEKDWDGGYVHKGEWHGTREEFVAARMRQLLMRAH